MPVIPPTCHCLNRQVPLPRINTTKWLARPDDTTKLVMKQLVRFSLLSVCAFIPLTQSACSLFYTNDRPEVQYQRAYSAEQLVSPPDLSGIDRSAGFVVSGVAGGKIQRNTLLPSLDEVRLVRDGNLSWLELSASSEDLWPLVRKFILREGYLLKKDEPLLGYMETTWAEELLAVPRLGLAGIIDKTLTLIRPTSSLTSYVFRFERSGEATTRLFISHRTIEEQRVSEDRDQVEAEFSWIDMERDPELEARVLIRLMVFLGIDVQRAKGILSEKDVARLESPAYILKTEFQNSALFIAQTLPLAWNEVENALENLYFVVEDNDIETGRFELTHAGAFLESKGEEPKSDGILDDIAIFFSSTGVSTHGYQVYLRDLPGGTYLNVSDENGDKLSPEEEHALLNAIRLQLI